MNSTKITFGKIFWPSLVAALIISILSVIIWLLVIFGIIGSFGDLGPKPLTVEENSVLKMTLNGEISEKTSQTFNSTSFTMENKIGVADILHGLNVAKEDKNIKGIFIEIGNIACGYAAAKEIRDGINDFEKSGKFVVTYNSGEAVSLKEYYISSAANNVYGFPQSNMEFLGLGSELMFFKGALDKLGVEVEIIRGSNNDFKSAVEPYFRSEMSDSSRLQMERLLFSIWEDVKKDIASERKVTVEELNQWAENGSIKNMKDAYANKLIDGVKYRDEIMSLISKKIGEKSDDELNFIEFEKYAMKKFKQSQALIKKSEANIAVILAEGGVAVDGEGLTSSKICKLFQEVRKNKSIKTVVFRINSPGGSALASEEIWREVKLTNDVKKVIVSMGDVAASGGYYIATPASRIFADPTTITGSIGVFGMIPYTGKMFENNLGLTFDRAQTNKHAIFSLNKKLSDEERNIIQQEVDVIYDLFKQRVADGRKMTKSQVEVIARGRVWTGKDAKKIGLVDEIGGLKAAISYAQKEAGISNKKMKVMYYPKNKTDKFTEIMEALEEEDDETEETRLNIKTTALPQSLLKNYEQLKRIEEYIGIQTRMPFELSLK